MRKLFVFLAMGLAASCMPDAPNKNSSGSLSSTTGNLDTTVPFWRDLGLTESDAREISYDIVPSRKIVQKCHQENAENSGCELRPIINNRLFAAMLDDLLLTIAPMLDGHKVRWWLDGGNLVGAHRFAAYLPWEDDGDMGMMEDDLFNDPIHPEKSNYYLIKAELEQKGLEIFNDQCVPAPGKEIHICQVGIANNPAGKAYFTRILQRVVPDVSVVQSERFWSFYLGLHEKYKGSYMPRMDFFTFKQEGTRIRLVSDWWQKKMKAPWTYDDFFPLKKLPILDHEYPVPNNLGAYFKAWFGSENILHDVVISRHTEGDSEPDLRFRDLRKHPGILDYFATYLHDNFGERFSGMPQTMQ